jgi:hypothetical protein
MCFMNGFLFSLPSPGRGNGRAWQTIDSSFK